MKSILDQDLILKGKKVIVRVDLNVPMKDGAITESSRIMKILPTIKLLIEKKAKIIIFSHIGRPKGKVVNGMSLKPISNKLSDLLNQEVIFNKNAISEKISVEIDKIKDGSVMMMENIRFYDGEEKNDDTFSKTISNLGDIYVNDAFSCSHRAHSSIEGITKYIPSYCGLQLVDEINALKKITSEIKRPVTCIIGGSKISTKIKIISNLIKDFDNIIIVGGMGNAMLKNTGINIGKSVCDEGYKNLVSEIIEKSETHNCKIYYPLDVVVSKTLDGNGTIKEITEVNNDEMILDIGPKTIESIKNIINNTTTVLWNGPAGYFENPNFANGTKKILEIIANKRLKDKIYAVAGGGETVAVINKFNKFNTFSFVSTAGGAFLEYLEGKELPGIKALK
ncbi:phosphoglycerate kinase [Candidatus Pelagibacter bacterium nBUS_33]|uniref:phosphoglycerate kinase n=1 Tax=Candidatus Pelagibacter bacterium nBUS_33 TaxID=3374193 RepID=UPI003EBA91EA